MIDFDQDVIEASFEKPIVVDFWAPWCAPCRVLGPVIEKIADEQQALWTLVKVNTEENQEVASNYGIRSIPNVKMFFKGKNIAEFAGALPRTQILAWLEEHLPSDAKEQWQVLEKELASVDSATSIAMLDEFVSSHPDHLPAKLALTRHIVFQDPARANALIANIKIGQEGYDIAVDVHAYTELISLEDAATNEVATYLITAQKKFQSGDFAAGIEDLIEAVKIDKSAYDDLPRRAAIAAFRLLGNDHPATKKYRRLFDMALY